MTVTHINRLRCTVTNTPGTSGNVVVGPATSAARRTFAAAQDGQSFEVTFEEGNAWETRAGCVYTHSTTTLSRGTLVDSSTGSAITLTSAATVSLGPTAKQMTDLELARSITAANVASFPASASWSVTWDTAGTKDLGSYTATGALAFISSDTGSMIGGSTIAAVIPGGFSATFDGVSNAGWVTSGSTPNIVSLYRVGSHKVWSVNGVTSVAALSAPATAVTMSGPTSGVVSVASTNFTLGANGSISGSIVVTPSDSSGGGTFTPTTVTLTSGSPTGTFTYTPASTGAKTISVTNGAGLTNPSNITYTSGASATVPGAPTIGTATAGDTTASVSFTAPGSSGGATITGYTATSTPGSITGTVSGAGSGTITVSGLTNGTSYTFTVHATNSVGNSSESAASNSVTPAVAASFLRADATNVRGTFTESGNGTTGWLYTCTTTGGTFAASFGGRTTPKLPTGAWVAVKFGSLSADDGLFGFSTTSAVNAYATLSLNAAWNSDAAGGIRTLSAGVADAGILTTISAGNYVRLYRATSTTVVLQVSTDNGATWGSTLKTWTVGSTDVLYAHFYPKDSASNNLLGPILQLGMTA